MSTSKQISVAVAGLGYWGPNLIRNLRSLGDCKAATMCDLSEKRLKHMKSIYPEVHGEMDFTKVIEDPNVDAIMIATPVRFHYEMAKRSLMAGKHTFIEKPMAASSEQGEELIDIARQNGLVLMIGHTFLYSSPVRRIKEIVQSGDIGEVLYISARRLNLGLFQHDINVTWDLAPHDISIIRYILDEQPLTVNCRGKAHVKQGIEDVTSMSLTFRNDRFATIQNSWLDPRKVREMTIVGRRRMIVYDDMEPIEKIKIYDARVETPPHYDTFAEFQYSYHYGDRYIPHFKQEEPLKTECQHFVDCVRSGATPISDGQQGLDVVKVLEAASISLKRNGAAVEISSIRNPRSNSGETVPALTAAAASGI